MKVTNVPSSIAGYTYVDTPDWIVPNVTCTPTTMHCPIPGTWAHVNYHTPSLYPEPAEGSCSQQKIGWTDAPTFDGCSDQASGTLIGDETDRGSNLQAADMHRYDVVNTNWAGNCDSSKQSYFWFEKVACGSTRTFYTDHSLIEDFVQLTPDSDDIQTILDLYYTTKAPLTGETGSVGITFITSDYHVAPVLPPKVNCSCMASMDAYASLLSVVSETPTPGAPVTLDPEVLNTGTSKLVAKLRMYHDPTYSIPASDTSYMPVVVSRFYLEVSTKFTRNRITITDCNSADTEAGLNASSQLQPLLYYCPNNTFSTKYESVPGGVTHLDRLSMKKFKFQGTTDVFMQCKIRACAQQPCGVCQRRQLSSKSAVDLNPAEGEMFA